MSAQWPPPDADPARTPGLPNPWTQNAGAQYPPNPAQYPYAQNSYPQVGPPASWTTAPPQRLSDQAPPRRQGRPGWMVALFGVVGVVVLGLLAVLALPFVTHLQLPTGSNPNWPMPNQSTPATEPTSSGNSSRTMPTDPEVLLKKNPIYAIKVPARCPAQSTPASRAAFRKQVKALVDCENAAWRKALAKTPVAFAKPKVVFYDTSINTPCNRLGTLYPAAYCTGDRTLYFSTAAYEQGGYYRLAVAQFVMHEYAHHVQELADIFASSRTMDEKAAVTTRRIELQAHCMAHYQLTHSGIGFTANDRAEAEYQFSYTTDAKGHGSAVAERYWGRRGLAGSTIGVCNTWRVGASKVK